MRVVYLGRSTRRITPAPSVDGDVIELLDNNWDDYGHKTLFQTTCRIGEQGVDLGSLKLLIGGGVFTTAAKLNELLQAGWDGTFPIPNTDYVSVPSEIEFYAQLVSLLGEQTAVEVARCLRDASYLTRVEPDIAAAALVETQAFRVSLQRERGAVKAYLDGWQVFDNQRIEVTSSRFHFINVAGGASTLELNFEPVNPLPHDINVLIGPNGVGKSRVLHEIVKAWLHSDDYPAGLGFETSPNISQLVVVSYSPLESFPVDTLGTALADREVYRYFGFRGRPPAAPSEGDDLAVIFAPPPPPAADFSTLYPRVNAALSLVDALADDQRYGRIEAWPGKLRTLYQVLRTGVDFDQIAVTLSDEVLGFAADPLAAFEIIQYEERPYLPIGENDIGRYNADQVRTLLRPEEGIIFFKDGRKLDLSSGQRLFSYVVVNVLGAIRRNSLILIDEPELFLHPTLEIQFIDMLKEILASLSSKALLATHSEVTVRETPRDCVHVFQRTDEGILVHSPPFQTFAGDIQRISSYVFGDRGAAKPYEAWIRAQLGTYGGADQLLAALGEDVNEELIMRIRAAEAGRE
ncbi:MAG: AAA family ATPase [Pseudomonadota bacterium]|nr:AAA family ATPase [Pseudomonadota bacterium]